LSKLDNDMRRDKSISGSKSIVKKGYWPYPTPKGYTNTVKYATADKHIYIINDEGKLLRSAFEWKASGKFSNQKIIEKLALKGMKVSLRNMAWIFANPFYCGYVYSALLPGELIPGKHPALIKEDIFLKANNISKQNAISGVPKNLCLDELPLKVFVRDEISNSPFTGYENKKKKLFYYKTRDTGTKINISAKKLNSHFENLLQSFEYDESTKDKLRLVLLKKLSKNIENNKVDSVTNKKRITELQNILSKLEERFVLNEITKEQFDKFTSKYNDELNQLTQEIKTNANSSSNLEKAVEKGLKIAENISQLWVSSDYYEKQQLQYLVFPEGLLYDKKNDIVRTNRINTLFREIAVNTRVSVKTKKDNSYKNCLFGSNVGMTGFEPATPSTPC
jgi:site-specific DNA recombinase